MAAQQAVDFLERDIGVSQEAGVLFDPRDGCSAGRVARSGIEGSTTIRCATWGRLADGSWPCERNELRRAVQCAGQIVGQQAQDHGRASPCITAAIRGAIVACRYCRTPPSSADWACLLLRTSAGKL
jgi:hypothetical protein